MFQALGAPAALRRQIEERLVDVYPENVTPLRVFSAMATQWRVGMGGATGLDYAVLPAVFDLFRVRKTRERARVFAALRVMEGEALRVWAEAR
jgi:hypothetical protein